MSEYQSRVERCKAYGIHRMNAIEKMKGETMSKLCPELEKKFWNAVDTRNGSQLLYVCGMLDKLWDHYTMDGVPAPVHMGPPKDELPRGEV